MANCNKFVWFNEVKFDLTGDTITPETILKGYKGHDKSGAEITGTCTYDSDTTDADIAVAEALEGKIFYARGNRYVGTMPNRGNFSGTISSVNDSVSIPQGYHDGSGGVQISETEKSKLLATNIKKGVTILGVLGSLEEGTKEVPQSKEVTPSSSQQVITPDEGYTCLSQVTVKAIPYTESANSAGGITITIG